MSRTSPHTFESPVAQQARDWVLRLASGDMDEQELQVFEQWLTAPGHRHAFEHQRLLWRSLGPRLATDATPLLAPRRPHLRRLVAMAAVAVLGCVLLGPELILRLQADHRASAGIRHVALPDGSAAVLDAGAAIAVHFGRHNRRVELLRGRVWFNVAPGHEPPLRVTVGDGVVEDISTAFVVSRTGDNIEATVEQGQVRVAGRPGQAWLYLQAGEGAGWNEAGVVMRGDGVAPDQVAPWRRGELLLENVQVMQGLQAIDRYRPGHILVRGDLSALPRINAALRLDHPEQALDALAAGSGLKVMRLPFGLAVVQPAQSAVLPQ